MKKPCLILPLALILCFMIACQDKAAMAELEAFKAQAEIEKQNKELTLQFFEALYNGDYETLKELLAPDYALYFPSNSPSPVSREELVPVGKMVGKAFPDINFSTEELFAIGDRVILRFIQRGTHEGEYRGIPATGNKYESSGILITRIVNGKVAEQREEFDMLGMMQQLGMELKPKERE